MLRSLPLILCLTCTSIFANESEPNDTRGSADPLPLNGAVCNGTLQPRSDVDFWSFQMPGDGYVDITLGQSVGNGSSLFQIAGLLEASDDPVTLIDFVALDGLTASSTIRVGLPRSRPDGVLKTYLLQIGVAQFGDAQAYSVSATFVADPTYEQEPNGTSETGQEITLGDTYQGLMNKSDDQDWFVFQLDQDSDLSISVRKDTRTDRTGPAHLFTLYSTLSPNTPIRQGTLRLRDHQSTVNEGLPARDGSGDPVIYYLLISPDSGTPTSTYNLTLDASPGQFFERSPNESLSESNQLRSRAGVAHLGRIAPRTDQDYYQFQLREDGEVEIALSKEWRVESGLSRFEVEVFANSDLGTRLSRFFLNGDDFQQGVTLNLSRLVPGTSQVETYFVIVQQGTSYSSEFTEYGLSVIAPGADRGFKVRQATLTPARDALNLTFDSLAGSTYTVQCTDDFKRWDFVRSVTGQANQTTTQVPVNGARKYFRVME